MRTVVLVLSQWILRPTSTIENIPHNVYIKKSINQFSPQVLQSKADELELERKNVLNLVEVTSAYIKELEGSIEEYKAKLQHLQNNASAANTKAGSTVESMSSRDSRPPPDGSSETGKSIIM